MSPRAVLAWAAAACVLFAGGLPQSAAADEFTTTTTLAVPSTVVAGALATFTATVTGNPLFGAPTGTVTFTVDGGNAEPVVTLIPNADGVTSTATFSTNALLVGTHAIGATYSPADWTTGAPGYTSSSATPQLIVVSSNAPHPTTLTLTSNPSPVVPGQPATFTATVTEVGGTGTPAGLVTFSDNNTTMGVVTLDHGVATLPNFTGFQSGLNVITASYTGNALNGSSSASLSFTEPEVSVKLQTTTTVTLVPNTSIHPGDTILASATIVQIGTGAPMPTGIVTFFANGHPVPGGSVLLKPGGVTDQVSITGFDVGTSTITAQYVGDENDFGSTGSATVSVVPPGSPLTAPTFLAYTGATTGTYGAPAQLAAVLTTTGGVPIAGKPVKLSLGTQSCSTTTTPAGVASCSITLTQAPGTYPVTATFVGDAFYVASSASSSFTIARAAATVDVLVYGPVAATGGTLTLTGALRQGTTPVSGRTLTLTFGGASCTAVTDGSGLANCTIPMPTTLGPTASTAAFAGDTYYLGSTASRPAILYAWAPGGGAFVIGDGSATGQVTFWSSKWSKLNRLSHGAAPDAFKGYAVKGTTSCGGTWSTRPGDSSDPPDGRLPAYLAVLVTSSVSKSGSTISGDTVHIVIVKTDPDRHDERSSTTGTGTVVATIC